MLGFLTSKTKNKQLPRRPPWNEIPPYGKWVYPYDSHEKRYDKVLAFLKERRRAIAVTDLCNVFCYSGNDAATTVRHLLDDGKIRREILQYGKRPIVFESAVGAEPIDMVVD